jgi:hypothetical protein
MFSGMFLNEDSIPTWLIWLKATSFIRYCYQALSINEFAGAQFDCTFADGTPAEECFQGDDYLKALSFSDDSLWLACVCNAALLVGFNAIAIVILMASSPKFLKLRPHRPGAPGAASTTRELKVTTA